MNAHQIHKKITEPDGSTHSHRLFADQVHKQYEHTVFGTVATLINSIILVFILRSHVQHNHLMIWLVCAAIVSTTRLISHRLYHKSSTQYSQPGKWNRWFFITLLLSGVAWGATALFLIPSDSIGHQAFIAFVAGGMVAGAVSAFTAVLTNFFVFTIPALLPICICFFLLGSEMHIAMGVMNLIFLLIMCLTATRMNKNILNLLSLKYEKTALVDNLQKEVHQRNEAQKRLQRQKGKIEEMVTQRTVQLKNANEALGKSKEKFKELVENINDALYTIDREGIITYISPVIESVLGYRPKDLIGNCFFNYVSQQDQDKVKRDFDRAIDTIGRQRDYRFIDNAGETKWCRISSRPISDGEKKIGIQGILVDIDWSKRLEEQLQRSQKMEALGTLAGGVAHDLNNILSGIVSYPELLLMDLTHDSPLRRPLTIIQRSGENAAAIVQDLLTLARRGVPTHECVNLNQIIQRCLAAPDIDTLLHLQPNIHFNTHLQPDLFNVYGSAIHIFKSLSNLIANAVEAMPLGGDINVTTSNRYTDQLVSGFDTIKEGEYVVLSVTDTGVGISERDQDRIFEPFYSTKVMGKSGSGLGMAVVWGTIKDHNGYIDVQSTKGSGTQFELYFPATRDRLKEEQASEEPSDFMGNGEFIIVIDDISAQREIATSILERLGYLSKAFTSGEEAIDYLRQHKADLIVLDMILDPGIDGYETYRQIKTIHPAQKAIISSGYTETARVKKTIRLGAGRYIKKPYTLTTIGRAIKEELQKTA